MADDRSLEQERLAQAERYITQAKADIGRQRELIQQLTRGGHETDLAETNLPSWRQTDEARGASENHSGAALALAVTHGAVRVAVSPPGSRLRHANRPHCAVVEFFIPIPSPTTPEQRPRL
jgi:hypothetical protein